MYRGNCVRRYVKSPLELPRARSKSVTEIRSECEITNNAWRTTGAVSTLKTVLYQRFTLYRNVLRAGPTFLLHKSPRRGFLLSPVPKKTTMMKVSSINFPILQRARRTIVALPVRHSIALAFRVAATDSARLCCSLERLQRVRWSDDKWMFCRCVCIWVVGTYNRAYLLGEE